MFRSAKGPGGTDLLDARPKAAPIIAVLLTAAFLLVPVGQDSKVRADIGPPGLDDEDPIFVPLRWCAMEGSPAVTNPAGVGEPDTDSVLWRRHERATDNIWFPGALISFRSAFTAAAFAAANFPIIPDPNPPPSGPGVEGDILGSTVVELLDARASCQSAWDGLEMMLGMSFEGPIAINFRRFVNSDGTPSTVAGFGTYSVNYAGSNPCTGQIIANNGDSAFAAVIDNSFTLASDPHDRLLAHELGHVLFLGHGNGLDDEPDGFFDACDGQFVSASPPDELVSTPPPSLMAGGAEVITTPQRGTVAAGVTGAVAGARGVARVTSGMQFDPPGTLVDGDVVADSRADTVHEVGADAIDIVSAGVRVNTVARRTVFYHMLFRTIPRAGRFRYLLFADLDNSPATGGSPSDLGFPTEFQGAERATRVLVRHEPGIGRIVVPTVWRFETGGFVKIIERRIRAAVTRTVEQETGIVLFDTVSVQMPNRITGPVGTQVRFEAVAQGPTKEGKGLDRLPDAGKDIGLPLFLIPPRFPTALLTPAQVEPGGTVAVEAEGLGPNQSIHVFLGDEEVATGFTDDKGVVSVKFLVPEDAVVGPRLITVGVMGTALSADTLLKVCTVVGTRRRCPLRTGGRRHGRRRTWPRPHRGRTWKRHIGGRRRRRCGPGSGG